MTATSLTTRCVYRGAEITTSLLSYRSIRVYKCLFSLLPINNTCNLIALAPNHEYDTQKARIEGGDEKSEEIRLYDMRIKFFTL